ncbi:MAG: type sorting protein [Chitinophagaceae bacterium]|nr:type sorting protein [Chitinophagaceae bacterium]
MVQTLRRHLTHYRAAILPVILAIVACFSLSATAVPAPVEPSDKIKIVDRYYPNPATSVINFEFVKEADRSYVLQIYSFMGKKVYESAISSEKLQVTVTDYFRGMYFYQVKDKTGAVKETGKFAVIHL